MGNWSGDYHLRGMFLTYYSCHRLFNNKTCGKLYLTICLLESCEALRHLSVWCLPWKSVPSTAESCHSNTVWRLSLMWIPSECITAPLCGTRRGVEVSCLPFLQSTSCLEKSSDCSCSMYLTVSELRFNKIRIYHCIKLQHRSVF